MQIDTLNVAYRGRLAPSPTGALHLGHAQTFLWAQRRAAGGALVLRMEDLDPERSKASFAKDILEDLHWLGIRWQEGPDIGGPYGPYEQSKRRNFYLKAWEVLKNEGLIYPCSQSRKDVERATQAPHDGEEVIFPRQLRPLVSHASDYKEPAGINWRFKVPDDEVIFFMDERLGPQAFKAGKDFGDFLIWRKDDVAAYELAVVVDDAAMKITEVVRGEDLLLSTARQVLLYKALGFDLPKFLHTPLVKDKEGKRLAKRDGGMDLRTLRARGLTGAQIQMLIQST